MRFFYVRRMASPMGGPCGETFGSAGPLTGSPTPHGSAHPFGDGKAEKQTALRGSLP